MPHANRNRLMILVKRALRGICEPGGRPRSSFRPPLASRTQQRDAFTCSQVGARRRHKRSLCANGFDMSRNDGKPSSTATGANSMLKNSSSPWGGCCSLVSRRDSRLPPLLVYGAKDEEHNQAMVLRDVLSHLLEVRTIHLFHIVARVPWMVLVRPRTKTIYTYHASIT